MVEIREKIENDVTIKEDTVLKGMIVGNVNVIEYTEFHLRGTVVGNLNINENTLVILRGTVNGDVVNNGGKLEIYGMINGRLFKESGETFIDEKAVIEDM